MTADWSSCECVHLDVEHATDGPCSRCECPSFEKAEAVK